MKVSIIIPVFNAEKYLRECIESVLNQTYKKIEIIAINDGSTDNSLKILEEFSDKIKVGKLDVDANQTSAAQQNVMSIPTLAIFKGGELIAQQVGALSKTQLTEFIESNL